MVTKGNMVTRGVLYSSAADFICACKRRVVASVSYLQHRANHTDSKMVNHALLAKMAGKQLWIRDVFCYRILAPLGARGPNQNTSRIQTL